MMSSNARYAGGGFALGEALPIGRSRSRRLARRVFDVLEGLPRGVGTAGAVAFIAATVLYGVVEGGHAPAVLDAVTARTGFTIDQVRIAGHRETSDSAFLGAMSIEPGSSLLAFDVAVARSRILELPWVEDATVQKLYPDAIDVIVSERRPFARWYDGERMFLVARDGTVITDEAESLAAYADLPLIAGPGAPAEADVFLALVGRFPGLAPRVEAAVRVGARRWDLELAGDILVRLPEADPEAALAELVHLDATDGLLARDIAVVDLRLPDRMTVRLTPDAAEARRKDLAKKPAQRKGAAT